MTESTKPSMFAALLNRRMLICVFTGFSSGLPLFILLNLLPAWLKTEGLSLVAIGALTLVQMPYTWKFLWSPLLDRYALPLLGRRRGWMLATQIGLLFSVAAFGLLSPRTDLGLVVVFSAAVAFLSATQDIVLDAYRRELLPEIELGLGNAVHVNAYKIAGLVPGSLSLILADPQAAQAAPKTLQEAVVAPFREFIGRNGWREALYVLAFIFLYKLGDSMCTALATPFYLEMGFSKSDIGLVAKHAGLWPSVIGGLLGGLWMVRLGINRALWVFGFVQWAAILGFAWLAWLGPQASIGADQRIALALVIGIEALGVGLGTAAFVAFIARTTHPAYTATQFALFTSLMAVPRTFINATTGWLVGQMGWVNFFLMCTVLALPGMLLLLRVAPWNGQPEGK